MNKNLLCAASLSVALMVACSGNRNSVSIPGGTANDKVYTGVLPAADAAGVRYTLKLDYDEDHGYTDGDYELIEVYIAGDSLSVSGCRDVAGFRSEGDLAVLNGKGADSGKVYLKLVQDVRDSSLGSNAGPLYFLVESDSTLVMVDDRLQPSSTPGLNYTLKLVR